MPMSKENIKTTFRHKLGPVVISQGIGGGLWGAYIVKPNGSLKRFKPIELCELVCDVKNLLDDYRGTAIRRCYCRNCNHWRLVSVVSGECMHPESEKSGELTYDDDSCGSYEKK